MRRFQRVAQVESILGWNQTIAQPVDDHDGNIDPREVRGQSFKVGPQRHQFHIGIRKLARQQVLKEFRGRKLLYRMGVF